MRNTPLENNARNRYVPLGLRALRLSTNDMDLTPLVVSQSKETRLVAADFASFLEGVETVTIGLDAGVVYELGSLPGVPLRFMAKRYLADPLKAPEFGLFYRALVAGVPASAALKMVELNAKKQGYICPSCGDMHQLEVVYTGRCRLVQTDAGDMEGTDDSKFDNDREWTGDSDTICRSCGYFASLHTFDASDLDKLLRIRVALQTRHPGHIGGNIQPTRA